MNVEVTIENETLVDLAVKLYGSANGIIQLLKDNTQLDTLTSDMEPGTGISWSADLAGTFEENGINYTYEDVVRSSFIVSEGQNLVDMAVQEYGSVEGIMALIKTNDLSLDEEVEPGVNLMYSTSDITNQRQKSVLAGKRVNTGVQDEDNRIFNYTFSLTFN